MAELSTLARPYARAAFEHAAASDALASWSQALGLLDLLVSDARVGERLRSPSLTRDQRAQLLISICGEDLVAPVRNFLNALAENDRLLLLPAIFTQFQTLKADHERLVQVQVTAAAPIDDHQREKLADALVKRLGRAVNIEVTIDPNLIGGAIIRAGDTVIDGSLRGRLNKLADALLS